MRNTSYIGYIGRVSPDTVIRTPPSPKHGDDFESKKSVQAYYGASSELKHLKK